MGTGPLERAKQVQSCDKFKELVESVLTTFWDVPTKGFTAVPRRFIQCSFQTWFTSGGDLLRLCLLFEFFLDWGCFHQKKTNSTPSNPSYAWENQPEKPTEIGLLLLGRWEGESTVALNGRAHSTQPCHSIRQRNSIGEEKRLSPRGGRNLCRLDGRRLLLWEAVTFILKNNTNAHHINSVQHL